MEQAKLMSVIFGCWGEGGIVYQGELYTGGTNTHGDYALGGGGGTILGVLWYYRCVVRLVSILRLDCVQ